ncbi:response regulator transcription factor [Streptomyces gilvus]|uniref:response regulator transcription factor n=1 Tax=Streptomyces gilvus TaxID=2920937 RepID=UPI001F11152A|nr:response regulator transcription factor [Streptomyces sp. CME 23]MCH5674439.1 response regulator transcription factor [Streptomyces sp. CME 23]
MTRSHAGAVRQLPSTSVSVAVDAADPITQAGLAAGLSRGPKLALTTVAEADVVVAAVQTADNSTLEALRSLPMPPPARIVLVVNDGWYADLTVAAERGVRAVLWRAETQPQPLIRAVLAVAAGEALLPSEVQGELLDQADRLQRNVLVPKGLTPSGLTTREIDVLRLVAQGLDLAEIAETMCYSERNIKKILYGVINRLGLRNRVHAVSYAIRNKLI